MKGRHYLLVRSMESRVLSPIYRIGGILAGSYTVEFGLVLISGTPFPSCRILRRLTNEGTMTSDNTNIGAKFVFSQHDYGHGSQG